MYLWGCVCTYGGVGGCTYGCVCMYLWVCGCVTAGDHRVCGCVWVFVCTYGCVGVLQLEITEFVCVCLYVLKGVWVCYSWRSQSLCPHYCTLGTPSSLSSLSGSSPAPSVSLPPTGSSARSTAPSRLTNVEVRVPLICSAASDCQVPLPCRASAGEQASAPSG